MSEDSLYIESRQRSSYTSNGGDEFVSSITKNLKSDIVHTNKDKLNLVFIKYERLLKNKHAWTSPFGIFSAMGLTLLTTDKFNSFLGIPPDIWKAAVIFGTFFSGCWLFISLIKSAMHWKDASIDKAIAEIMTPDSQQHK